MGAGDSALLWTKFKKCGSHRKGVSVSLTQWVHSRQTSNVRNYHFSHVKRELVNFTIHTQCYTETELSKLLLKGSAATTTDSFDFRWFLSSKLMNPPKGTMHWELSKHRTVIKINVKQKQNAAFMTGLLTCTSPFWYSVWEMRVHKERILSVHMRVSKQRSKRLKCAMTMTIYPTGIHNQYLVPIFKFSDDSRISYEHLKNSLKKMPRCSHTINWIIPWSIL